MLAQQTLTIGFRNNYNTCLSTNLVESGKHDTVGAHL